MELSKIRLEPCWSLLYLLCLVKCFEYLFILLVSADHKALIQKQFGFLYQQTLETISALAVICFIRLIGLLVINRLPSRSHIGLSCLSFVMVLWVWSKMLFGVVVISELAKHPKRVDILSMLARISMAGALALLLSFQALPSILGMSIVFSFLAFLCDFFVIFFISFTRYKGRTLLFWSSA